MKSKSRYIVGIDLGTTNSAAAYIDSRAKNQDINIFKIPQITAPGEIEYLEYLPSFHYEPVKGEFSKRGMHLPWETKAKNYITGVMAREHGMLVTGRAISSAKSWLCHQGVDRTAPILPWHGAADVEKLSPVQVSSRFLLHICSAWNHSFPADPLSNQEIILTVPASFDEVARELTMQAANLAGLNKVYLLEEPQAAFYAWIFNHRNEWEELLSLNDKVLVCDVGGGTTDFTLIELRKDENKTLQFHRFAVGQHLILGGDNLDLTLARFVESQVSPDSKLPPRQWEGLLRNCCHSKEIMLSRRAPEKININIPGTGSKIIGGTRQFEITLTKLKKLLLDGFLPKIEINEKPALHQSGFQEFGLPYAADSAITRYLADFLSSSGEKKEVQPDKILFNGGLFFSYSAQRRLINIMKHWFKSTKTEIEILSNDRLDLAVAKGAVYYGLARGGGGIRIHGGITRSYYMGVKDENSDVFKALCLVPAGLKEGETVNLSSRKLDLVLRYPVEFPLYISRVRTGDKPEELIDINSNELTSLPPIRTVLESGKKRDCRTVKVTLQTKLNEIGTLEIWCKESGGPQKWRLQFNIRSTTVPELTGEKFETSAERFIDSEIVNRCQQKIFHTFNIAVKNRFNPEWLMNKLEYIVQTKKWNWPVSFLRILWESLMEVEPGRKTNKYFEARWLNLTGFTLRPGYGYAADDWRVAYTVKLINANGLIYTEDRCLTQWWILFRRISGGLTPEHQLKLANQVMPIIRRSFLEKLSPSKQNKYKKKWGGKFGNPRQTPASLEFSEIWRLIGSLELLPLNLKQEIGEIIILEIEKDSPAKLHGSLVWALARLASRKPAYSPLNLVLPGELISEWLLRLMKLQNWNRKQIFTFVQLARYTGDRFRDIPQPLRNDILSWLKKFNVSDRYNKLILEGGLLSHEEQNLIFGEQLPAGLRIST